MKMLQPPKGLKSTFNLPKGTTSPAFVVADVGGRRGIWYAFAHNGRTPMFLFPVLENGKVSKHHGTVRPLRDDMPVYEAASLGIKEVEWVDEPIS